MHINIDSVVEIQKQAGIPAIYVVLGGVIGSAAVLNIIFGPMLLCNLIGFIYPAYASYKCLKSDSGEENVQWVTYWVIYGWFNVVDTFADVIIAHFPFYVAMKFGLLLWLFSPNTLGASFVYKNIIRTHILGLEGEYDIVRAYSARFSTSYSYDENYRFEETQEQLTSGGDSIDADGNTANVAT